MVKPDAGKLSRHKHDVWAQSSHVSPCPSRSSKKGIGAAARVVPVDSGPAGGYPTGNGSCLHLVASIPANFHFMQKFLFVNCVFGVYATANGHPASSIKP